MKASTHNYPATTIPSLSFSPDGEKEREGIGNKRMEEGRDGEKEREGVIRGRWFVAGGSWQVVRGRI